MERYKFDCGFGHGRHGLMIWPKADECVGGSLEKYGEYSRVEVDLLCKVVREGMTVVDVGANIGALSVPMGKIVREQGMLIAFEPQFMLNKLLTANLVMNDCWSSQVVRALVGKEKGVVKVPTYTYKEFNNYGALGIEKWGEDTGVDTPIVTIDSLGLESCEVMKIDAEGMEKEVIEGAKETIKRCWPFMFVENDREKGSRELIRTIKELGYRMLWFVNLLYAEDNYYQEKENIFGGQGSFNMVCVPPEGVMSRMEIHGLREVQEGDTIGKCSPKDLVLSV